MSDAKTGGQLRRWWTRANAVPQPHATTPGRATVPYPQLGRRDRHDFAECEQYLLREIVDAAGAARRISARSDVAFTVPWLVQPWSIYSTLVDDHRGSGPSRADMTQSSNGSRARAPSARSLSSSGKSSFGLAKRPECVPANPSESPVHHLSLSPLLARCTDCGTAAPGKSSRPRCCGCTHISRMRTQTGIRCEPGDGETVGTALRRQQSHGAAISKCSGRRPLNGRLSGTETSAPVSRRRHPPRSRPCLDTDLE